MFSPFSTACSANPSRRAQSPPIRHVFCLSRIEQHQPAAQMVD
ncbi:hypothetical protein F544_16650 [Bibersteinia trehalosi USDA-ARS-USMARC-190]|uniref:Uncharacterized protein n=1 Tax=Bibersteinia trehalosi USDA-ARS-USMARC-190 TaxID=1263832 RepID=W0RBX5_BIBTR|nr:hypothetical protein F544_16650 [Bibersteinia trehalosi USDA-ARS-USMARC-190]